jgi:hypothetical protein
MYFAMSPIPPCRLNFSGNLCDLVSLATLSWSRRLKKSNARSSRTPRDLRILHEVGEP